MFENNKFLRFLFKFLVILIIIKLIFKIVNFSFPFKINIINFKFFEINKKYIEANDKNYKYKRIKFNDISNIKIEDSAKITLKENNDSDEILIRYYDCDDLKYDIDVKNDTLMLKNLNLEHKYKNLYLKVLLPKKFLKNIDINNINGDIDIKIDKSDKLIIKNENGEINVKINSKILEIKNKNGNIKISNNIDNIKIRIINGDIDFTGISKDLNINNVNGNINFTGISNDLNTDSINGNVNCKIKGKKNDYNIDLSTFNGSKKIYNNSEKIDCEKEINNSQNTNKKIKAKTVNGNILIEFL